MLLFLLLCPLLAGAQPYTEGRHTRHRFAQLLLGADMLFVPGGGTGYAWDQGQWTEFSFPALARPRLIIGGTHFWGHADFYVSFPLGNLLSATTPLGDQVYISPGVETGARLYPWAIRRGALRPFVGAAFASANFRLRHEAGRGLFHSRNSIPLMAGLTYQTGNVLLEAGARYQPRHQFTYYGDRQTPHTMQLVPWGLFAGVKYSLETTLSAEKPYRDGSTARRLATLEETGGLNGFSLAIGPSSAFVLGRAAGTYNEGERAFLGRQPGSGVFPELGLGYYHHRLDAHVNLAARTYATRLGAYDFTQTVRRQALTLEAYKYLFDFHGFVPFVGPSLGWERWRLAETDGGQTVTDHSWRGLRPGLTFGWDIRPDRLQGVILRTNLRYTPFRFDTPGDTYLNLQQLEFNFIQVVIYPGRIKAINRTPL